MLLITMLIVLSVAVAFAAPVTEDSKIQPDFLQDDVSFGAAVAANGNHFVAAAPRYAGPAPPPTSSQGWGRIVEYQWDGNVFTQVSYLDGTDNCQQFSYILDFSLDATGEGLVAGIKKQNCSALFPVPSTTSAYHRDLNGLWEKVVGFSGVRDSVSVTTSGQTPTFLTGNASATVTTDSVTEIDMNNWEGQGYHNNDVGRPVEIAAPTTPGGVTATAEIGRVSAFGGVSRIDVLSGGSGYTSNPNVTLPAPIGGGGVPGNASASRNAHVGSVTFSDVEGILPNETLKPGDGSDGDLFGGEVAIDGDVAAIAARGATKVYIAERAGGGWEITQTLEPAAADTSGFGQALALAGDHLVVGAPGTDNGGLTDVGRAFYFDLGNLAAGEVVLTPAAPVARESFGAAVAVSEDGTVVVGAPGQIYQDLMVGRAFIYAVAVAGNVPELAELVPSDGAVGDDFGLGIAIVEGQALVGAPDHDNGRGAVYVFDVVNDLPAVDAIADPTIDEDDSEQTVNLTGISAGGGEAQPLRVTAASNNRDLVPDPAVTYTSPAPTGSLQYTPVADQSGTATITVTVEDGGLDGDLDTAADNATFSREFTVRFPTDLMFELTLTDGWNLFSIPIDLDDSSVATVLQGRNTGSVWGWANNKYTAVTNLAPGQGYWVKLDGATIIEVTGPPAISTRRVLAAGWNLIGAIGMPPYNDVLLPLTTVSGDSVNAPFWGWTDAHYTKQDDLQMGHGYWGFSSGPGTVELGE